MLELQLSEQQLHPELISCRLYDSTQFGVSRGVPTPVRTAKSYEFSIYLSEGGSLLLGDRAYPIRPGLCRFIAPGTRLCSIPHYKSYSACFSLSTAVEGRIPVCRNPFLDAFPQIFICHNPEACTAIMEKLARLSFRTEPGTEVERTKLLLELLLLLHHGITADGSKTAADRAVAQVQSYLEAHLEQEINLNFLGELTGYHPLYLQRIFKQATGQSPHTLLTQLRLNKARELLSLSALPISQIAAQCGYSSVSHFTNRFRRAVGCSPLAFRKQAQILP